MSQGPLVPSISAKNVVVVGRDARGSIIVGGELRRPRDCVIDFGDVVRAGSRGFVGRGAVLAALNSFRKRNRSGYFEIVADAGLGKTALAARIVQRYDALVFFADASQGLTAPEQFLTHLCAALITRFELPHEYLPAGAGADATYLGSLLREAATSAGPVLIVVDALDEAQPPPSNANPLLLPTHLPAGVHAVVTRRPGGARLLTRPDTPQTTYPIFRDAPDQQADVEKHLRRAVRTRAIRDTLARARPPIGAETFVERLKAASEGNFMYLSYVLGDLAGPRPDGAAPDLDDLPEGLLGYYDQFWSRMQAAAVEQGWADWNGLYRPVIERLAVAAEPVTPDWLGEQVGRPAVEVRERVLQPWSRLLGHEGRDGGERWHIVHRSFADFLSGKVDLAAAHRAVAGRYVDQRGSRWAAWDDYGLRHVVTHLARAAGGGTPQERLAAAARMASLVLDPGFREAHLQRLRDPSSFERDLELTVRVSAADEAVPLPALAEVALALVAFRREQRRPQPVFDLARQGDVEAAERRLDLFALEVDAEWYRALQLTIAWLGADAGAARARQLRDRVRAALAGSSIQPALALLLGRVDATLDGGDPPPVSLPRPVAPDRARAIVARLSGSAVDRSFMSHVELMNRREPVGDSAFLSAEDGPDLVAVAAADPGLGEPLLEEYLAIHAAYGYREYRQGSLWALLGAVLHHPRQEWVRRWVPLLGAAALAPNRGDFRESLPIAALALEVLAGSPGAAEEFERRRQDELRAVDELPPPGPGMRGAGDTWGTHRRRLAALAEASSRLPGGGGQAGALIGAALGLRFGYAGFNAPACLALAEAVEIATGDLASTARALAAARASAHNIQDATFCARSTARVNAVRERWWGEPPAAPLDAAGLAGRLAADPSVPAFAALHLVGESYEDRDPGTTVPLPAELMIARTLDQLAGAFRRPLEEFLRLNAERGWAGEQTLPAGTRVDVPDPGLAPLLAARLAGRCLADASLSGPVRRAAIRSLVPVAAADTTALDTVLARLALASAQDDHGMASALARVAAGAVEAAPAPATLWLKRERPIGGRRD